VASLNIQSWNSENQRVNTLEPREIFPVGTSERVWINGLLSIECQATNQGGRRFDSLRVRDSLLSTTRE
jgi:hypothetical protein